MEVSVSGADRLLEDSLDSLAARLSELAADYEDELEGIRLVLGRIPEGVSEAQDFRTYLKELAYAVIRVRTDPRSPVPLKDLPVPPYDLWLPFKARDITAADREDLPGAIRIFNHKVGELAFSCGLRGAKSVSGQESGKSLGNQ